MLGTTGALSVGRVSLVSLGCPGSDIDQVEVGDGGSSSKPGVVRIDGIGNVSASWVALEWRVPWRGD